MEIRGFLFKCDSYTGDMSCHNLFFIPGDDELIVSNKARGIGWGVGHADKRNVLCPLCYKEFKKKQKKNNKSRIQGEK